MDFNEAEQKRMQFSSRMRSGQLTPAQFSEAMTSLQVTDTRGTIWQPNPSGSGWIYWTGSEWQTGTPPGMPVPNMAAGTGKPQRSKESDESKSSMMTIGEFKKISKELPLAKRPQRWWDLFSILGGITAAAIWFLYGSIRSGNEGFDLVTPLLMIAIPVILVRFRADIDKLLLPLQPYRKKVPRPLLIGLGIAAPFLTAWVLYNIFSISQYPLMQANIIIGITVSYVIVRDPVIANEQIRVGNRPPAQTVIGILFLALFATQVFVPVMADDCIEDPFNAQDCLRTNGFAEIMAGATAAGLVILINGPIILQGILGGGATGTAATAGVAGVGEVSSASTGKIYGTGTRGDPYRDGSTLGEVGPDGRLIPYPENVNQPPKIYGTGTRNDPYRDYPDANNPPWKAPYGDGSSKKPYSDTAPPVIDTSPTPPDAPSQPPVKSQPPVSPVQPPQPPVRPVQPPVFPVQPPQPQQPPEPPRPTELTPAERQELETQRGRLRQDVTNLQATWKRRKWLDNYGIPQAFTNRTYHLVRAAGKAGVQVIRAGTDPKGVIFDGVKNKLGVKTPDDVIKEGIFGKEVEMSPIVKEAQDADKIWRELKSELKALPSEEQMLENMRELTRQISVIDGKLAGGK